MKSIYTEREIETMHAAGVTEIQVGDDVLLTDLAREKAAALGIGLTRGAAPPASASSPAAPPQGDHPLAARVKAAVVARLGTEAYNELLDQIIPRVLARLGRPSDGLASPSSPSSSPDEY